MIITVQSVRIRLEQGSESENNIQQPEITNNNVCCVMVLILDDNKIICEEFGLFNVNAQEKCSKFSPISQEEFDQMSLMGTNQIGQPKPSMRDIPTFDVKVARALSFEETV